MLKVKKTLIAGLALTIVLGLGYAVLTQQATVPQIPGITSEDKLAQGCVNCHKEAAGKTGKLSVLIKDWSAKPIAERLVKLAQAAWPDQKLAGKHPDVSAQVAAQDLPKFCITCHAATSKMPLSRAVHLYHYDTPEKSQFVTLWGGWCTNCHALDKKTGADIIKNGKETK